MTMIESENRPKSEPARGYYYMGDDNSIKHDTHPPDMYSARLEHIAYTQVNEPDNKAPTTCFITRIHPNEKQTASIMERVLHHNPSPRLEITHPHLLAEQLGTRGRRYFIIQPHPDEIITPKEKIVMESQAPDGNHWSVIGKKIDFNRQFPVDPKAGTYTDIMQGLSYINAQLLFQLLWDNPNLHYLFSFHEDVYRKGNVGDGPKAGLYIYDCAPDARSDTQIDFASTLHAQLARELTKEGFSVYNGIDARALRNKVQNGRVYQPNIDAQGTRKLDKSLESFAVELARLGLGNIQRSFCFEIPGKLTVPRKTEMVTIIMRSFVQPFLNEYGIPFTA